MPVTGISFRNKLLKYCNKCKKKRGYGQKPARTKAPWTKHPWTNPPTFN